MAQIMVAEDDPKQAEIIRRYLAAEGHRVSLVRDGRAAVDASIARPPELLVLDVMMPRLDGLDVCRILRAEPRTESVPILILTARATEDDLLDGLDLGADDYLTKPFSPREMVARIRALLRRSYRAEENAESPVAAGPLVVSPVTREVTFRDQVVACTRGEFALLHALASQPARVFTRQQLLRILDDSPSGGSYITPRTVDTHVANLRKKLDPALIRTVYGVGYALTDPA